MKLGKIRGGGWAVGIAIGVVLGLLCFKNLAIGIGIGVALGIAFETTSAPQKEPDEAGKPPE